MTAPQPTTVAPTLGTISHTIRRWTATLPTLLVLLLAVGFVLAGLRLISVGADDLRLAGLFSTDEELAGELVKAMLAHGNFGLSHFYSYGPLDLYTARAFLGLWSFLHPTDDRAILLTLRSIALLAGAGTVGLTYAIGRCLWNALTGVLAAALIAASATVLAWATTAHPDMLQLLLLELGLLAIARRNRHPFAWIAASSAAAGLAAAAKYGGIFLLPAIWLAFLLDRIGSPAVQRPRTAARSVAEVLTGIGASLVTFVAVFLLVDPSVPFEWRRFVYQVQTEAALAHGGHLHIVSANPALWISELVSASMLGPLAFVLAAAGAVVATASDLRVVRRSWRSAAVADWPDAAGRRLPIELWTLGYLLFLLVWSGDVLPRYALPALPGLAIFAAAAVTQLPARLPNFINALVCLLMLAPLVYQSASYEQSQIQRLRSPAVSERIAAGRWLGQRFNPSQPILRDAYAYVPAKFDNTLETFELTRATIASFRPRVIVTDAEIRDRFRDPGGAATYAGGAQNYQDAAEAYAALEAGQMPCYPLLERFGPETIYGLLPDSAQPGRC